MVLPPTGSQNGPLLAGALLEGILIGVVLLERSAQPALSPQGAVTLCFGWKILPMHTDGEHFTTGLAQLTESVQCSVQDSAGQTLGWIDLWWIAFCPSEQHLNLHSSLCCLPPSRCPANLLAACQCNLVCCSIGHLWVKLPKQTTVMSAED
jgi:hypothetical protein